MAKTKSPLLSIGAHGAVGKSVVFASWRGVPYARQHIVPANPQTTEQSKTRNVFSSLSAQWVRLGAMARAPWDAASRGKPLTNRNAYTKSNIPALRGMTDMTNYIGSPGALGGLPPTSLAAVTGSSAGEIDITIGTPEEPTGWTLASAVAVAIADRAAATMPTEFAVEGNDATPTAGSDSDITLSGLTSGGDYIITAWLTWTRPDTVVAYGASLTSAVVTAGA